MADPNTIFDVAEQGSDPNTAIAPPPKSEYSIDTNPNRAEPLNPKTEYMVMDKKTGNTIAVPFSMGDKQRDSLIQGSIYNNPQDFKDGVYETLWKPMIESGGANANVFQNPGFVSEAMGKGAMQGGTASIYRPSGEESQLFDKFAHDPELMGQFGGFGVTTLGGGFIAKAVLKTALAIPAVAGPLADIFTGNIAKLGLEGAEKVGEVAATSTVAGSTMGIYDAISNTQNQLKDNEERVKNGQDPIPLDWMKIGAHAAGQGALFALIGGIGAQIARPLIGMSGIEATGQVAKELAVTGGSMWAIAKVQGANDDDAGLMAFAAVALHSVGLPGSVADRTNAIKQMKYAMADHVQLSNDNIDPSAAYEVGKSVVNEEIGKSLDKVDQSKEYQNWLQKNADDGKPEPSYMNVPLHPASEGREAEAARNIPRKNAEQYSDDDISDIKKMMSWERDQQDGDAIVSGGKSVGSERVVTYPTSGHSESMQAIGPQESFRLMDKAINGEKLMQGGRYKEQDKMQKLLDDFRVNVKPHLDDQDFRIASNQESLGNLMKNLAVKIVDPAEMNWPSEEEQPVEEPPVVEEEKQAEEPAVNPMTGGLQEETGKFGEGNKLFTEQMANDARESIKSKLSGLHSGVDPTILADMVKLGGYHFEGGVREFGAWSKKMIDDLGEHVKPYLQDAWDKLQKQAPQMAQTKEATEDELAKQEYFPLKPLGIKEVIGKKGEVDLNKTGRDIVKRYIGRYQEQVVRVQDLSDDIRGLEKDKAQQDAMSIFASVGGDEDKLKEWIAKADALPDGDYNKEYWEKEVKPAAELALNLSDGAKEGIKLGNQYFKESGLAMKAVGAIRTFLNNYGINRLYQDEPAERVLKGNDFNNPEQSTGHAKKRFYENMIDAVIGGKRFKTMNYPDLIGVHGEEAASVTVGRQYAQESAPKDMGGWVNKDSVPAGWKQVGNMSRDIPMKDMETKLSVMDDQGNQKILHQVFVAPKAIADDMSVITDPDNLKKVGFMQKAGKLNDAVKSFNVMIGLFHDKQFILQKLASPGGVKGLKDTFTGQLGQLMQTKDFKDARLRMLRTGVGMSNKVNENIDVLKNVANPTAADTGWLKKITSLPIIKHGAQLVDWHRHNLFEVMGEYYKVDNFRRNTAQWDLKNPNATDEERLQADRGYAQASNNAFGGHNWAGLGFSKEAITAARTAWFAPDWLYSALRTGGTAVTDWKGIAGSQGTEGSATRAIIVKNLIYGTAATQLANYMINGHFTNDNTNGHKMEIELSPKNHISMYPAATGELVKLMSDIVESGPIGVSRYLQGKLSPILRLGATWASHTSYSGQDITKETGGIGAVAAKPIPDEYKDAVAKQVNYVAELASTIAPLPFVVQPGPAGYVGEQVKNAVEGKPADLAGSAGIVSGLSRFSQGESEARKSQDIDKEVSQGLAKGDNTAADKYLKSGDISQERIDQLQAKADETPVEKSYKHLSVEKIIKKADDNIDSMNADDKDSLKTMLDDKYDRMQSEGKASPNEIKRVGDLLANFYDKHKIQ